MDLLRFTTAGSVDDGKSTLIGRLLYDTKSVSDDQLAALEEVAGQRGDDQPNLALLTDGLRDEREQGITIDVAYRFFATARRAFIIADTPGHVQYTRNMVTGASTANLALVLVDARRGVLEQTRRHALIASLLRIPHLLLCVNKMDLVGWSQDRFEEIVEEFSSFASRLEIPDIRFLPLCALHGDNVAAASPRLAWHRGGSLLYALETAYIGSDHNHVDARFPVQTVIRPSTAAHRDYRGLAGRVAAGVFRPGDPVVVLPGGRETRIRSITALGRPVGEAFAPMSVEIALDDDLDAGRGDMLAKPHNRPAASHAVEAMVCWFSPGALVPGGRYRIRHTTREALAVVREVRYKVDVGTLHRKEGDRAVGMNDIARVLLRVSVPLLCDPYKRNRSTGSFILMDEFTNATVAAGMVI